MTREAIGGMTIDLDKFVEEQEAIMRKNEEKKEKDPERFLKYAMARAMKVYKLKIFAEQADVQLVGKWIRRNGQEVCSVCWLPRKTCELNGECVGCGARMEAWIAAKNEEKHEEDVQ